LDIQRIAFNTPFNPSALPAESAEQPLLFPEPEVETPKQKPSPNKNTILRDTYQDSMNWGGRLAVTNSLDAVSNKALAQFPQLESKVNKVVEQVYTTAEKKFFQNPLGYDQILGIKEAGVKETLGGLNNAKVIEAEVGGLKRIFSRLVLQGNMAGIMKPLGEASKRVLTTLGAGVASGLAFLSVLSKTKEGVALQLDKENQGKQTRATTVKNSVGIATKEAFIAVISWEACRAVFNVLASVIPQTNKAVRLLTFAGGILLASLTSNTIEKGCRSFLKD
jgi:hypothetical protein